MVPAFKWLCELLLNPRPGSQIEKVLMMSEEAQSKHREPKRRCEVCGGSFGLIRHRLAFKQFCSKHCLDQLLAKRKQPFDLKQWMDFARASAGPQA
jgi:tRNA U54 and U55 pseudouridine synthase Pus10